MSPTTIEHEKPTNPKSKCSYRLTMEVPVFVIMLALNLGGGAFTNVMLYRVCTKTLNYTDAQCELVIASGPKSDETMQIENEAQQHIAMVLMAHSLTAVVVPAILALFLGPWSDKYGRIPLVKWPLLGMSVSAYMMIAFAAIPSVDPWWYLITAIPNSVSGGFPALITGALCYMADISTEKERTFKISMLEIGMLLGIILGTIGSPYLLQLIGTIPVMTVVAVAYTLGYLFTLLCIKESVKNAKKGSILTIFDLSLVKDMVKTCFKKRPNKRRNLLFLLLACCIFSVPFTGTLDYLYTRSKLQWSLEAYSIFSVVTTLLSVVGLVIGVGILQKMFNVDDIWLTFISFISSIVDFVIKAFATESWHMYLGTGISLFRNISQPILRALLSKILPSEDVAKVFAMLTISNVVVPMTVPLVFHPLYSATINDFPGSIYLVTAAIYVVITVALFFAKYYLWRYPLSSETENSTKSEPDNFTKGSVPTADNEI